MKTSRVLRQGLCAMAAAVLLGTAAYEAVAQRGGGFGGRGPQLEPEVLKAVWQLESKSVAGHLELDAEATEKLSTAYQGSRDRLAAAVEAAPQAEEGDWQARREQFQKLGAAEKEAFGKELEAFLDKDKAAQAASVLGSYSRFWDMMANSLKDIVADEANRMKAVYAVGESLAKFETQPPSEDRREARRKMMEDLNTSLKDILSEDEFAKWEETFSRNRRERG